MDWWGAESPVLPPTIWGPLYVGISRLQYQEVDQEVIFGDLTQNDLIIAHFNNFGPLCQSYDM